MAQTETVTQTSAPAKASTEAASTPMPTTALSARVLKKRETDRRCQRMIRERTKSRIAYLEGLVEQFRSQDSSGRVETLMRQLAEVKEERDVLAKKVKSIQSIVGDSYIPEESEARHNSHPEVDHEKSQPSQAENTSSAESGKPTDMNETPSRPTESPPYKLYNKEFAEYQASSRSNHPTPSPRGDACECCNMSCQPGGRKFNKWLYANDTLTAWFKWSPEAQDIKTSQEVNDDIPIRAVVEGWDAIEQRNAHPAWLLLKGIDQHIFSSCEERERLAILIVMGLLIQAHLNPTRDQTARLPSFYLKRPSQDMLRTYATEYFAWPGLRERFIHNEHRYCSNIFWKALCNSFRILWPYEFRDCYTRNTETGLYSLSPTFSDTLHDIRFWAMGNEMFQTYPELYTDIPAWNSIPGKVSSSPLLHSRWRTLPPSRTASRSINGSQSGRHLQQEWQDEQEDEKFNSQTAAVYEHSGRSSYSAKSIDLVQSPSSSYLCQTPAINGTATTVDQQVVEPFWGDWSSEFGVDLLQMDVV